MNYNDINAVDATNAPSYTIDFVIPQGEKGDTGAAGPQGIEGPAGPQGEIVIGNVTTGAPGTQATVTITPTTP